MTQYNKANLATFFQTNDIPTGTDYSNLIDSYVNQVETAVQSMAGPLNPTEIITPRVSATDVIVTGTLTISNANLAVATVSASNVYSDNVITSVARANIVSATSIITTSVSADSVYASAGRFTSGVYQGVGIVSAAGSAQSTAAPLVNIINRGKGVVDGQTTGFGLISNRTGLTQYLYNEGASANLWPPTGGTINGLAANAAFSLAASAMFTIIHLTASAMAVK